jgi:hypothetical protein
VHKSWQAGGGASDALEGQKRGEELNQRSRLLFNLAANNWYTGQVIDVMVGIAAAALSYVKLDGPTDYLVAVIAVGLALTAYFLKLRFEGQYDMAETMRRQSILTEGLGYPIGLTQFDVWKARSGRRVDKRFRLESRDPDYYASKAPPGPTRLVEMLEESAFYTRHLYVRLRALLLSVLTPLVLILAAILFIIPALGSANPFTLGLANAVLVVIPIAAAADLIGALLKLTRLINAITDVEIDVENLKENRKLTEPEALRLCFEYNCLTAAGYPVHNYLFRRWHASIAASWAER